MGTVSCLVLCECYKYLTKHHINKGFEPDKDEDEEEVYDSVKTEEVVVVAEQECIEENES